MKVTVIYHDEDGIIDNYEQGDAEYDFDGFESWVQEELQDCCDEYIPDPLD